MRLDNRGQLTERPAHRLVADAHLGRDLAQGAPLARQGPNEAKALAIQLPAARIAVGVAP